MISVLDNFFNIYSRKINLPKIFKGLVVILGFAKPFYEEGKKKKKNNCILFILKFFRVGPTDFFPTINITVKINLNVNSKVLIYFVSKLNC